MSSSKVFVEIRAQKQVLRSENSAKIRFLMINTEMTAVLSKMRLAIWFLYYLSRVLTGFYARNINKLDSQDHELPQ